LWTIPEINFQIDTTIKRFSSSEAHARRYGFHDGLLCKRLPCLSSYMARSIYGERLQCQEEYGNPHDMYAVSVIRDDHNVGHLLCNISTPYHMFLHSGGAIVSVVNGARRYSADLEQGGLV